MSSGNLVCSNCVGDHYLKLQIHRRPVDRDGACDYCSQRGDVIYVADLAEKIRDVLHKLYTLTTDGSDTPVEDRIPRVQSLFDVIADLLMSNDDDFVVDVGSSVNDWDPEEGDYIYGEDPWFVMNIPSGMFMNRQWVQMLDKLKHEARYINPDVTEVLEQIFGPLENDRTLDGQSLITLVGPEHKMDAFYRARAFHSREDVATALKHPERELGPPPKGRSSAGRMNARGVSVFYGANDPEVALSEIRPPVGSQVLIGKFELDRELRLLDLTKFADVTNRKDLSPFEPDAEKEFRRTKFLPFLASELVQPVMPEQVEDGYLLTQVISDYLSTHRALKIDGILFPSIQLPKVNGAKSVNAILFVKASTVALSSPGYAEDMDAQWWYKDPDGDTAPIIEVNESIYPPKKRGGIPRDNYSLILDRESLKVYEVTGAKYHWVKTNVRNESYTKSPPLPKFRV